MSIYRTKVLADESGALLLSLLGEELYVVGSNIIDLEQLSVILQGEQYESRFRLLVLNPDETINFEIPQEDIILNSGNFSENYQQGQRKNLNLSLVNIDKKYTPNINTIWVHSRFRFDIGIESEREVYWFPRGIYIMSNPTATHIDSDKQVSLTLTDKFSLFSSKAGTLEATYEIPQNTLIKDAIRGILSLDNGSGYQIDTKEIVYDRQFDTIRMPYTVSKDAGSTLEDMLLEIAMILNAECYYNSIGHLCFIPINETINDTDKPTLWIYDDSSDVNTDYLNNSATYDFENVVNEVHVVGDNINNDLVWAWSKNDNPASPICIQRIGRRIDYINDSNIYNEELAQDRANYELRKRSIVRTSFTVTVSFNPLLLVNNLVMIEDSFFGFKRDKFLIQSITYGIGDNNAMTLTLSNLDSLTSYSTSTEPFQPDIPNISLDEALTIASNWWEVNKWSDDPYSVRLDSETEYEYTIAISSQITTIVFTWIGVNKETGDVGVACLTGDTKILTTTGSSEIKDLKVNDVIMTVNGQDIIERILSHTEENIYIVNNQIKTTGTHIFSTTEGYLRTTQLEVGTILKTFNNQELKINDISFVKENIVVYEIKTKNNYDYILAETGVICKSENI